MEIKIEIENCRGCPHHKATPYPTSDSFERPEYWWCQADDKIVNGEEGEITRLSIKKEYKLDRLRYIMGYVEWNDKIPIPEWCPCKLEE